MLTLGRVTVTPGFWGLLAFSLCIGAGEIIPLVGMAALCHEMGHLVVLRLFGADVEGISFTGFGVEIQADTRRLSYGKDILCTLAGPAVNLVLALVFARVSKDYLRSGANLLQGMFNLLPVSGLDGSRASHLALSWLLDPMRADRICRRVEFCCAALICVVSVCLVLKHHVGLCFLLASVGILRGTFRNKPGK